MDENNNIKKAPNVPPFLRYCSAIIPTAFDDSLSYYEALCALYKWIQDNLIGIINNNATVTQYYIGRQNELEALFEQLKEYVDTYFDNLDVQEEINNKLDSMAEAGTLAEIISEYLNSIAVFGYDTVATMKVATNFVEGSFARTLGYYSVDDKGGALYRIRKITNDDTIDESTIIEITGDPTNTLVAEIVGESEMCVKQFGAKGDGVTDDSVKLQIALNYTVNNTLNFTDGTYIVGSPLSLTDNTLIGTGNTVIKAKTGFIGDYISMPHNAVTIKNIKFDCDGKTKSCVGDSSDSTSIIIDNCTFTGTMRDVNNENYARNSAVNLSAKNIVMTNSIVIDNLSHGARLHSRVSNTDVNIDNCKFINNGSKTEGNEVVAIGLMHNTGGQDGEKYRKVTISNCYATGNANTGIAPHACNNIVISNCVCNANGEHGICLMDGKNAVIANCICLNNDMYGIRLQGDYNASDEDSYKGFKNCTITGCYVNSDGMDIDGSLTNINITGNTFVYAYHDSGASIKAIRIGKQDYPTEFMHNLSIVDNSFSGYLIYPIQAFIYFDDSCTFDNIIDGKRSKSFRKQGGTPQQYLCNSCSELKYGESNNKLTQSTNFSNWTLSGGATCVNNVITRGTSTMVARTSFNVSEAPKYISVLCNFQDYTEGSGIGIRLRFRDSGDNLLASSDEYTDIVDGNYMCRIFDISSINVTYSNIAKVEVCLLMASESSSVKFNYCYASLTDEPPIIPNVIM